MATYRSQSRESRVPFPRSLEYSEARLAIVLVVGVLSNWLHAGEEDIVGLYRRPWPALMSWGAALALSPGLFAESPTRFPFVVIILILVGLGILSWKRQAAVLTKSKILFRPIFGTSLEIPLSAIKRVSRTERPRRIYRHPGGDAGWIEVSRLEFLVGGFYEIPFGYWGDIEGDLKKLMTSNTTRSA